jgi:hypothetical protein
MYSYFSFHFVDGVFGLAVRWFDEDDAAATVDDPSSLSVFPFFFLFFFFFVLAAAAADVNSVLGPVLPVMELSV